MLYITDFKVKEKKKKLNSPPKNTLSVAQFRCMMSPKGIVFSSSESLPTKGQHLTLQLGVSTFLFSPLFFQFASMLAFQLFFHVTAEPCTACAQGDITLHTDRKCGFKKVKVQHDLPFKTRVWTCGGICPSCWSPPCFG